MSHRRLLVFKVYFSPLFDTPSASRTIVTSQTSQYFNTAVTVSPPLLTPRIGPYHGYALKKPSPTVEPAGGDQEGNDTQASYNIDTITQPKTLITVCNLKLMLY